MTVPTLIRRALLPEGLRDDLPPLAEHEAAMVDRLMAAFSACGYERVAPPLVEFEDSLLAFGGPSSQADAMFRLLDPTSGQMMALRSDMTLQVARIATTRLAGAARPLRLSYAGHVLRVKGNQLRPARQFRQAGVELIGAESPAADLEVILLAAEALRGLGIEGLSVDLVAPTLVPAIAAMLGLDEAATRTARVALDARDIGGLDGLDEAAAKIFTALMRAAGPAEDAGKRLAAIALDGEAARIRDRLVALAGAVAAGVPDLAVTLDPGEVRGYEFQTGIGFAFFARAGRGELGRGGRYLAVRPAGEGESSVGFSMYLDSLLRVAPPPAPQPKVYCARGEDEAAGRLRAEGWRTVAGLEPVADIHAEARRLGCSHVLVEGKAFPLEE